MRNPVKAILVALLIAIPAPLVLGFLLTATPEPLRLIAAGEVIEALGSDRGIAAYLITLVLFGLAGFLAIALVARQPAGRVVHRALRDTRRLPRRVEQLRRALDA